MLQLTMNMKTIEHNDKEIDMWHMWHVTCDTPAHTHIRVLISAFYYRCATVNKNNSIENFIYFFLFFFNSVFFLSLFLGQRKKATWKISHARWGDIFHGEGSVNLLACSPLDSKTSINSHTWTATTIRVVFSEFN